MEVKQGRQKKKEGGGTVGIGAGKRSWAGPGGRQRKGGSWPREEGRPLKDRKRRNRKELGPRKLVGNREWEHPMGHEPFIWGG